MGHLTNETLARLVDEAPSAEERDHLHGCDGCREALEEMRRQTGALGALPALRPPPGGWRELEARLRSEGLVAPGLAHPRTAGSEAPRSGWLQAAAALVLFLGGAGVGSWASGSAADPSGGTPVVDEVASARPASVEEAATRVQETEERYIDALVTYRELLESTDDSAEAQDPTSRFAAIETLVAASQAAVREAPADPFLNGILASTVAERQAVLRQISTSADASWY